MKKRGRKNWVFEGLRPRNLFVCRISRIRGSPTPLAMFLLNKLNRVQSGRFHQNDICTVQQPRTFRYKILWMRVIFLLFNVKGASGRLNDGAVLFLFKYSSSSFCNSLSICPLCDRFIPITSSNINTSNNLISLLILPGGNNQFIIYRPFVFRI